jgi:hypothetical protein
VRAAWYGCEVVLVAKIGPPRVTTTARGADTEEYRHMKLGIGVIIGIVVGLIIAIWILFQVLGAIF